MKKENNHEKSNFLKNNKTVQDIKSKEFVDPKLKFLKYEERKNIFLKVMNNNFKKKLEKNNIIRLNAEKKK